MAAADSFAPDAYVAAAVASDTRRALEMPAECGARIWCENEPARWLADAGVLRALVRRHLRPIIAVRPWTLAALVPVLSSLKAAGVSFALWPMLDDAEGRWLHRSNVARFARFGDEVLQACAGTGVVVREVFLDLEPPVQRMRAAVDGYALAVDRAPPGSAAASAVAAPSGALDFAAASRAITDLVVRWARAGVRVSSAIAPFLVWDVPRLWPLSRALGTPSLALPVWHHHLMAYTSMMEGYSRGLLGRLGAERVLRAMVYSARKRLGAAAAISLGAVGAGALGNEPVYRDVEELTRDVHIVRAGGIREIGVFELAGIFSRPHPEAWLDALACAS